MSSHFSGALRLTDLDDFIAPSQECIKPVEIKKEKSLTGAKLKLNDAGFKVDHAKVPEKISKVEITLADCLACSGCITSAESVLITEQSQEELLKVLTLNKSLKLSSSNDSKLVIISLAVQPIVSLSIKYGLSVQDTAEKVSGYFKSLGADLVIDMKIADDISLVENATEFIERYHSKQNLPMLASACPGWVCYAEKAHGYILPNISTAKSPQQVIGSLVKDIAGERVYHVTLMPCYDKKLEASRQDFYDELLNKRDVDCVITPIELEQMLLSDNIHLSEVESRNLDDIWKNSKTEEKVKLYSQQGSNSGGYSSFIFKQAARDLFNIENAEPVFTNVRNPDFKEASLTVNDEVVLRFAIANGFKNIQNIMQKMKRGKVQYDFIEIMACPSGCLNGGAQNRPAEGVPNKQYIQNLEEVYSTLPVCDPHNNENLNKIYKDKNSDKIKHDFHTSYKAVEKSTTSLLIKW
ncbi:probable cytosolic Fe-S cluster assembly factor AAEL012261 [Ctenocephalides felis]|uniref:probable cytosolic Fe-S cluster assembly factor AAEL012261 n=1 Tax=Ctenocephalides felis TaxID=7515 RepID=UPI000E6E2697|nr:probable cytosolic Fe-S cluster assembly factor AAEL012261 [Ctenocephalides felis]